MDTTAAVVPTSRDAAGSQALASELVKKPCEAQIRHVLWRAYHKEVEGRKPTTCALRKETQRQKALAGARAKISQQTWMPMDQGEWRR